MQRMFAWQSTLLSLYVQFAFSQTEKLATQLKLTCPHPICYLKPKNSVYMHNAHAVHRKHATAHYGTTSPAVVCRDNCVVVRWLIVVIYCPSHGLDSVRSYG